MLSRSISPPTLVLGLGGLKVLAFSRSTLAVQNHVRIKACGASASIQFVSDMALLDFDRDF